MKERGGGGGRHNEKDRNATNLTWLYKEKRQMESD